MKLQREKNQSKRKKRKKEREKETRRNLSKFLERGHAQNVLDVIEKKM